MQIDWLASYPKSGNTWVRFLLYHYHYGETTDSEQLNRRVADIHTRPDLEAVARETGRLLVKTHWKLSDAMPHHERSGRAIYVVRHPRDVLLSMLNYTRLVGTPVEFSDADYAKVFIAAGGDPGLMRLGIGTWEENVLSWTSQRAMPTLLVKYEDLKADAGGELRRMLEFLGDAIDEDRIARAADLSSFERLRALEAREKSERGGGTVFAGSAEEMSRGRMFMNRGQSGQRLASIAPGLDEPFARRFGAMMRTLGYEA